MMMLKLQWIPSAGLMLDLQRAHCGNTHPHFGAARVRRHHFPAPTHALRVVPHFPLQAFIAIARRP
jgi:hypothetical protein